MEIFDEGGRATCGGRVIDVQAGDSLLLKPGVEHALETTGPGRLYCLTVMVPDDAFATLIRSGVRAELDAVDPAMLSRVAAA